MSFLKRSDYGEIDQNIDECPTGLLCTIEEVKQLLLSLNTTKSSGCNGISATMLKEMALNIAPGITKLFNTSIQTGVIPEVWKLSSIVPIPKGSKHTTVHVSITTGQFRCHLFFPSFLLYYTNHLDAKLSNCLETMRVSTTEIDSVCSTRYSAQLVSGHRSGQRSLCCLL